MLEPAWVDAAVMRVVHARQIAEHGESRYHPRHVHRCEEAATTARPAAAYAAAITRNHPFVDGNKRTALVVLLLFLDLNGWRLEATEEGPYLLMLEMASSRMGETELATWLQEDERCRQPELANGMGKSRSQASYGPSAVPARM